MPDAPKNTVPRQSQKALSWWQKILLAVFGAYFAEKLFGILIPSLPHVSLPSTSRETAPSGDVYDNDLPYRRAYEEDEEDQRNTSDDDAYADTYGGSAPYGGQSLWRMRTSSTMTGTTTARGMTTIISTIDTPSRVRCACVIAYTRGEFL